MATRITPIIGPYTEQGTGNYRYFDISRSPQAPEIWNAYKGMFTTWEDDLAKEQAFGNNRMRNLGRGFLEKLLRGNGDWSGSGFYNSRPVNQIPRPRYVGEGGVWTQRQIDNQANLQRAQLYGDAARQDRGLAQNMAARGFSPMSPMLGSMQNQNMWRAYQGAAANETGLNFDAAKANRDAQLQAQRINAGIYGDYARALAQQQEIQARNQMQGQSQRYDLITRLLGMYGG
jgi:hypothetical protein